MLCSYFLGPLSSCNIEKKASGPSFFALHTWKIDLKRFGPLFLNFSETLVVDLEYLIELSLFNLSLVDESQVQNLLKLLRK